MIAVRAIELNIVFKSTVRAAAFNFNQPVSGTGNALIEKILTRPTFVIARYA
jgi:hypothetical protein